MISRVFFETTAICSSAAGFADLFFQTRVRPAQLGGSLLDAFSKSTQAFCALETRFVRLPLLSLTPVTV